MTTDDAPPPAMTPGAGERVATLPGTEREWWHARAETRKAYYHGAATLAALKELESQYAEWAEGQRKTTALRRSVQEARHREREAPFGACAHCGALCLGSVCRRCDDALWDLEKGQGDGD